jgi:hypothetical protein
MKAYTFLIDDPHGIAKEDQQPKPAQGRDGRGENVLTDPWYWPWGPVTVVVFPKVVELPRYWPW